MQDNDKKPPTKVTPLWIVAAFVTLTETVLSYAVTQVTGGVQIALTVFVISFALAVAGAFFLILWHKPWVFYAPSEYQDVNPKDFMSALRDSPGISDQIRLAKSVDENPFNVEAKFELIDSMADDSQCQWIIYMHESGKDVSKWSHHIYEHADGGAGSGSFGGFSRVPMDGTGILEPAGGGRYVRLTAMGHDFAKWLVERGRKCSFFWSPYGGWGTPQPNGFAEKSIKEMEAKKAGDTTPKVSQSEDRSATLNP